MHAKRGTARHDSKERLTRRIVLFVRHHARGALIGAGLLVVGAVGDSIREDVKDLFDSIIHPTLQKNDLVWVPADCPGGDGTAAVGLGGCARNKLRGLAWFSKQILAFKAGGLRGFDSLPDDLSLVTQDSGRVKNNILVVERPNATELGKLGVGYSLEKNAKDGCLRLYSSTKPPMRISPVLCLDKAGRWWSKESDDETAARLKLRDD